MATNQNHTQSVNANRQDKTKAIKWEANPLGHKQNFTFKNCKAWNRYKQTCTTQYIRGEINPHELCAGLNLPDDRNPWNVLRSVIDQFYQREKDIAWKLFESREAREKAQQLEERNRKLWDTLWKQDERIGELKTLLENDTSDKAGKEPENTDTPTYCTLKDCNPAGCALSTIWENHYPCKGIRNLIELYNDRGRQLQQAKEEIESLKIEKERIQEIADIALRRLLELEEKVNAAHR